MNQDRHHDLIQFYRILSDIEERVGGTRQLCDCSGRMPWPGRGVYFFFEEGEMRSDTGRGRRIVRVGTHALSASSKTTLWNRLSQHKGNAGGAGGNHRGSIFRLLVGDALPRRFPERACPTWGKGSSASNQIRAVERELEGHVSAYIGAMPFLWLSVKDDPGPSSLRGFIERNAIALLSNFEREPVDPASAGWLGKSCSRDRVRRSDLWNNNHVDEEHESSFLGILEDLGRRES